MSATPIDPESLGAPRGYSNGMLAPAGGRVLAIAGQIAWDRERRLVAEDFPGQFERALGNVLEVVHAAGGRAEDVLQLVIYVVDKGEYLATLKAVGEAYRRQMGRQYPAMALLEVRSLLEPGARVEIQGLAVLPP